MSGIALGFAGRMASGKTTISLEVATRLGWPRVAFGDYVRSTAIHRSVPSDGASLQALGERLIEEMGWLAFCQAVLSQATWRPGRSIVIDGIRHVEVVDALRRLVAPAAFCLVLVEVDELTRNERAAQRDVRDPSLANRSDVHSTEAQFRGPLPARADLRVDGTTTLDVAADLVVAWIEAKLVSRL